MKIFRGALAALVWLLVAPAASAAAQPLELKFLDVGQADAILIQMGRRAVLVDASRGDDIVLVLAEQGVDSLVAAIGSHNHDDHIGGMDAVLSSFPVGQYFFNHRPPTNNNARSVEEWLTRGGIRNPPPPWEPIMLGDVRITVFPSVLPEASENNSSLGVLVERGGFRALLTGDSEVEALNAWMDAGIIPDVDVLKAAHHGARDGVTPGWINRTKPEVVVISVGATNQYGHPHPAAMRYYQSHRRTVYRTDTDGTVTVTVNPDGTYRVTTAGPIPR